MVTVTPEGLTNLWINGVREITDLETNEVSNIVTNTESIGSTAWGDPGHSGTVNEFRIWRGTLTEDEVTNNLELGPDVVGDPARFEIISAVYDRETGAVDITWNAVNGRTYAVEASDNLSSWSEVDDGIVAEGSTATFRDMPSAATRVRYYRVTDLSL